MACCTYGGATAEGASKKLIGAEFETMEYKKTERGVVSPPLLLISRLATM